MGERMAQGYRQQENGRTAGMPPAQRQLFFVRAGEYGEMFPTIVCELAYDRMSIGQKSRFMPLGEFCTVQEARRYYMHEMTDRLY